MVYVSTSTNSTNFGTIVTRIGEIWIRSYQNPAAQKGLQDGFLVALKKGDVLSVTGSGLDSYGFTVYY